MKKVFHKILSILMVLVVLFSTMSFNLDMHYCGSSLVDFGFFTKADTCGMEKEKILASCEGFSISGKPCCSDQKILKEGHNDLKDSIEKISFEQQFFAASFSYTYINLFEGLDKSIIPFKDYSPPFIERNAQILYETYLI